MHMAQLMPLPLTISCFSKIQIGFTFLVPAHPGSPGQRAVKRVCVCSSSSSSSSSFYSHKNQKHAGHSGCLLNNTKTMTIVSVVDDRRRYSGSRCRLSCSASVRRCPACCTALCRRRSGKFCRTRSTRPNSWNTNATTGSDAANGAVHYDTIPVR